jgi:DNA polymerase
VLVIDFETYFDDQYSLKNLSTIEFITDPRFEVVSCAFTWANGRTVCKLSESVRDHIQNLQCEYGANLEGVTVVAQNANFDLCILWKHYGINPPYVIDLLGLARHINSRQKNDLATLCKQYKLKDKGDTSNFKNFSFRERMIKPKGRGKNKQPIALAAPTEEQISALREYNVNDNLREWELFTIILPLLSNPKTELRIMQSTLELFTKPVLEVDMARGEELIRLYDEQIEQSLPEGLTRDDISGNKSFEWKLGEAIKAAGESVLQYTKWGKKGAMLALAKADDSREVLLNHPDPAVRQLMKARVAVKSWPLHISRVQSIMAQAKANDGVLCVPLKYCGAHTGRDSGGEGINLQNLSSRGDDLLNAIRHMIVASKGHKLVIVDAAQIEGRGTPWIAGQQDSVDRWAAGVDQYSHFASKVLGYQVRKPSRDEPEIVYKRLKWARDAVGKIGVLGCGYGMGAEKAMSYAKGAIDLDTATKIVETFRREHSCIVQFWRDVEKAFVYTAKYRRPCSMPRGIRFDPYNECGVLLTLPNSRELHYPITKLVQDKWGEKIELYNGMTRSWEHTWGGGLTENIVQAFCRDAFLEAMLRIQDQGYPTALRVHDELVICVPEDEAEKVLEIAIKEMSVTPVWAAGLPLGAEGNISQRYGKE